MIFLSVGTQLPFDRLVRAVDSWAEASGGADAFAQIGRGGWRPRHMEWAEQIPPAAFAARARDAGVMVSHAGVGAILTALEYAKPIIIMPRLARLREHRNDHQLATVEKFGRLPRVYVAQDEELLVELLDGVSSLPAGGEVSMNVSADLVAAIREFIHDG